MKSRQTAFIGLLTLAMLAVNVHAAMAPGGDLEVSSTSSAANLIQIVQDGATGVRVRFSAVTNPTQGLPECDLLIGGSSPSNVFTGDLLGAGYTGVRFKMTTGGVVPDRVMLMIRQSFDDGRTRHWYHMASVSPIPGEWVVVEVPFDRELAWTTPNPKSANDSVFESDFSDVHAMILQISPHGLDEQVYGVKDFQLVGTGTDAISAPAVLTALQYYFGVNSIDEMEPHHFTQDTSGDGMSDYHAILAGLDPMDVTATLRTSVSIGNGSNTIAWQGVLGKTYGVLRSTDLMSGFTLIKGGLQSSFDAEMTYVDESPVEGVPNFYKVVVY